MCIIDVRLLLCDARSTSQADENICQTNHSQLCWYDNLLTQLIFHSSQRSAGTVRRKSSIMSGFEYVLMKDYAQTCWHMDNLSSACITSNFTPYWPPVGITEIPILAFL